MVQDGAGHAEVKPLLQQNKYNIDFSLFWTMSEKRNFMNNS